MSRRWASAAGGLIAAVVIVVLLVVALGSGGASSSGPPSFGNSLLRIRARNLRLQSLIAVLTERQTLRIGGYGGGQSTAPEPTAKAISRPPGSAPAPAEPAASEGNCDPNYEGACLDPSASDYDCEGGSGDGPDHTGEVRVVGVDEFGLDRDGDGIGCEPAGSSASGRRCS